MFDKILIANRGEIACRIIRTCRSMGVRTVAVFSDSDAKALHVQHADEACNIGGSVPSKSYLRIEKLINAAKKHGAQAIHPGYGFLSENAEFARMCSQSGIVFIGPSVEAIEIMGAKDQSKIVMENAGVPIVPGYKGAEQSPDFLHAKAEKIGYPIVIKAVLGGGGKGMRAVLRHKDFPDALESAKSEARTAFGDDQVLLELFVSQARHIEFQIFGDLHGNVIHLFERDCTLQRRHQKIIEESPSPILDEKLRSKMAEKAVLAAKTVKYTGAGTVEFVVGKNQKFFFIEMNTRLQVEHPVTEMIAGLDLVEWQLRIAAGEKIPLSQKNVKQKGHAIETRIYAENTATGFLPSIGILKRLVFPETFKRKKKRGDDGTQYRSSVRIDTGVEEGCEISFHYDPLIAKLVVHADSRNNAISLMQSSLAHFGVIGLETNLGFLQTIFRHPDFNAAKVDTMFVDSNFESLLEENQRSVDWVCWGTAIFCLLEDFAESEKKDEESMVHCSPWNCLDNWRTGVKEPHRVLLGNLYGVETEVRIIKENNSFRILNEIEDILVSVTQNGDLINLTWNNKELQEFGRHLLVLRYDSQIMAVYENGRNYFTRQDPLGFEQNEEEVNSRLLAPMPGNIIRVHVIDGEKVIAGQPLLVMEAMKMEYTIIAPSDGIVEQVLFQNGDLVTNDAELIKFSSF